MKKSLLLVAAALLIGAGQVVACGGDKGKDDSKTDKDKTQGYSETVQR